MMKVFFATLVVSCRGLRQEEKVDMKAQLLEELRALDKTEGKATKQDNPTSSQKICLSDEITTQVLNICPASGCTGNGVARNQSGHVETNVQNIRGTPYESVIFPNIDKRLALMKEQLDDHIKAEAALAAELAAAPKEKKPRQDGMIRNALRKVFEDHNAHKGCAGPAPDFDDEAFRGEMTKDFAAAMKQLKKKGKLLPGEEVVSDGKRRQLRAALIHVCTEETAKLPEEQTAPEEGAGDYYDYDGGYFADYFNDDFGDFFGAALDMCPAACAAFADSGTEAIGSDVYTDDDSAEKEEQRAKLQAEIVGVQAAIGDCQSDKELLQSHHADMKAKSSQITEEKRDLFGAQAEASAAAAQLKEAQEQEAAAGQEASTAAEALTAVHGAHDNAVTALNDLVEDEKKLQDELAAEVSTIDSTRPIIASATAAIDTVSGLRTMIEQMLLAWTQYYEKSVIQPVQHAAMRVHPDNGIEEFKKGSHDAIVRVERYCKANATVAALAAVPEIADLAGICDAKLKDAERLSTEVDSHVGDKRQAVKNDLTALETRFAYQAGWAGNEYEVPDAWPVISQNMEGAQSVWPKTAKFFGSTAIYKEYLRGWKQISEEKAQTHAAKLTAAFGSHTLANGNSAYEGMFVDMDKQLAQALDAAEEKLKEAEAKLVDIRASLKDTQEDIDKAGEAVAKLAANKAAAQKAKKQAEKALADARATSKESLEAVASAEEQLALSHEALEKAQQSYISTHSAKAADLRDDAAGRHVTTAEAVGHL